ncbi:transcriptional regulator [Micrococcaceae bacterium RIT802]|nr:transcriptional regulator [Micrococcaceae bacterium RIT 802]
MQPALRAFEDPTAKARELLPLHRAWSEGSPIRPPVREIVARSWMRQPSATPRIRPLDAAGVADRRERSPALASVVPLLRERLLALAADAGNQLVISDDEGYILWVEGPSTVRRRSDGIGFMAGARWREADVGTNALGTSLAERAPVQIFGPEHAREEQHTWVCTSTPLPGPGGTTRGTITLSGSYRTAHPHTLTLICAAAHEAAAILDHGARQELDRLAARTPAPAGAYLLVDDMGQVAASAGIAVHDGLHVPAPSAPGPYWVAGIGTAIAERVPGGWLLALDTSAAHLELRRGPSPAVVVHHRGQETLVGLSARHLEILEILGAHPEGLGAEALLARLQGATTVVTVRAELSRLRRRLGGFIESRPYRLAAPLQVHG